MNAKTAQRLASRTLAPKMALMSCAVLVLLFVVGLRWRAGDKGGIAREESQSEPSASRPPSCSTPNNDEGFPVARQESRREPETPVQLQAAHLTSSPESEGDVGEAKKLVRGSNLEAWFARASYDEARDHLATLKEYVRSASKIATDRRFMAGDYEIAGHGTSFDASGWDESKIRHVRLPGVEGEAIQSVVLPREEFPELYEVYDEMKWLEGKTREPAYRPTSGK
jgi:hypothetical protein